MTLPATPGLSNSDEPANRVERWLAEQVHALRRAPLSSFRFALGSLGVLGLYLITAWLGHLELLPGPQLPAFWPLTGVMLAVIYFLGLRYLFAMALGGMLLAHAHGASVPVALGESLTRVLTVGFGAVLLLRWSFHPALRRRSDVLWLAFGASAGPAFVGALLGTLVRFLAGELPASEMASALLSRWLGDAVGIVAASPLAFTWVVGSGPKLHRVTVTEALALVAALIAGSTAAFTDWIPRPHLHVAQPFIVFPFLLWAAYRFEPRMVAFLSWAISNFALWSALWRTGGFSAFDPDEAVVVAQLFSAVTVVSLLALCATNLERRAAAAQAELLAAAVRGAQDGLAVVDSDLRVTFANDALLGMLGLSGVGVLGAYLEELGGPFANVGWKERLSEATLSNTPVLLEGNATGPQGHLDLEAHLSLLPETPVRFVCVVRDVTVRKQLQAQLTHQVRLASLGTLAAGVAHEINNPLTYVLANLQVLAERLASEDPALLQRAKDALEGAERIRVVVQDLRSTVRGRHEEARPVDLNGLVHRVLELGREQLGQSCEVELDLSSSVLALGSEMRLSQVLLNLLVNAADAVKAAGQKGRIRLRTRFDDSEAVLEVEDDGLGIAPEHLPRIWEPFFTTKTVGHGMGLGLYVCHRLVTEHGGKISVRSAMGVGTTFSVRLPGAPPSPSARVSLDPPPPKPVSRRRVLIIDDEVRLGNSMRLLLETDFEVGLETQAEKALARLIAGEPWDVILCDLHMPGLSGMELYEHLLSARPELAQRIVFMSGGAYTEQAQRFVEALGERVLEKPIRPDRLFQALAS